MGFEEFLPDEKEEGIERVEKEKMGNEQVYDVITSRKPDWHQIIYDLIASEQLDPWDIDLVVLTRRYFEKIAELEEQDFYISSKVLLAASLLLRIKSEFLLNRYIKSIDDILFGRKEENKYAMQRIEIDSDELPMLIPKTPMPRLKRVTLDELMNALNKAINTETRRIKKELALRRAKKLSEVDFPTFNKIDLKDRVRQFYARVLTSLKKRKDIEKESNKIGFTNLAGADREQKVSSFLPLLHLSNSKKLWLEQENHLDEIWIYLYDYFDKNKEKFLHDIEEDENEEEFISGEMIEDEVSKNMNLAEKDVDSIAEEIIENEKISEEEAKEEIRKEILEEIKKENLEEEKEMEKEKVIDKISGFSDEQF